MFGRIRDMALAGRRLRRAQWSALVTGLVAWGCNAEPGPGSDSTTHFWDTCSADIECGSGEQCVCGRCSHECEDDDACVGVDVQCVGSLPALKCDPPNNVCAPSSALKVPQEQDPDASIVEVSSSSSAGFETATDAGISTTASPTSGTTGEPAGVSTQAIETSSVAADRTDVSTANTDAVSSGAELSSTREATLSSQTSSEDASGETGALAPVMTLEEKYAAWGTPWSQWIGARPESATGCELNSIDLGESGGCIARWGCTEHTYDVTCSPEDDGAFSCSCDYPGMTGTTGYFSSIVFTTDPAIACEAGLAACTTADTQRECVSQVPEFSSTGYTCELTSLCTFTAQPSGVEVTDYFFRSARCSDQDGSSLCRCSGVNLDRSYVVQDVSGEAACVAAQGLCNVDPQPQTWQHAECMDEVQVYDGLYELCMGERTCPLLGELSEQATALSQLRYSTQCSQNPDGELDCVCYNGFGVLQWVETRSAGKESCFDALELCQHSEDIVFASAPECASKKGDVQLDTCGRSSSCRTTGTFQGTTLEFTFEVNVGCDLRPDSDTWGCHCEGGRYESYAEFDGDTDPAEICTQYQTTCQAELEFGLEYTDVP